MGTKKQWVLVIGLLGVTLAAGQSVLHRVSNDLYGPHSKAHYLDPSTVEFVRPGLTITANSAAIASNGTISVTYTLTDPSGLPLDSAGVNTPGTIALSFIAATIPVGQEQYVAYTVRAATGAVGA